MVNFELGRDIGKDFYRLVTSVGQRKNSESSQGIEPQTFRFHAPMLYHWATKTLGTQRFLLLYTRDKMISIFLYFF